jgi:hypothetical protein
MKTYNFFTLGENDEYGQAQVSPEVKGQVKMAVYISSQAIQDNINYQDCNYVALTADKNINDSYLIEYLDQRLKVQYVNPQGRMKVVYLKNYD